MKKHLIFDLDGTLVDSGTKISEEIITYFRKNQPDLVGDAEYALHNSLGLSLQEILYRVFQCDEKTKKHSDAIFKILAELRKKVDFFPGVPEKIKQLSKEYKLYISTGNSDSFAQGLMEIAKIKDCFEMIMGSNSIQKSSAHLEIFASESDDPDFYKNSVFIGDGDRDREIAQSKGVDFIRIGYCQEDPYCIPSVLEIDRILEILNNK